MNVTRINPILSIIEMRQAQFTSPLVKVSSGYVANDLFNLPDHFLGDFWPNIIKRAGRILPNRTDQLKPLLLSVSDKGLDEVIRLYKFAQNDKRFECDP